MGGRDVSRGRRVKEGKWVGGWVGGLPVSLAGFQRTELTALRGSRIIRGRKGGGWVGEEEEEEEEVDEWV